jgi:hypothetical protein
MVAPARRRICLTSCGRRPHYAPPATVARPVRGTPLAGHLLARVSLGDTIIVETSANLLSENGIVIELYRNRASLARTIHECGFVYLPAPKRRREQQIGIEQKPLRNAPLSFAELLAKQRAAR